MPFCYGGIVSSVAWTGNRCQVLTVGVEPTRPFGHRILSPARFPFRHMSMFVKVLP